MTETAIAIVEEPRSEDPLSVSARVGMMRAQVGAETEIRALVKEYIARNMVRDSDFGVIPGTVKPSLLKPGAEKLVDLFNVVPEFEVARRVEEWDRGLFHYEVHVKLRDRMTGSVRAEGMGSANSREARYRWRNSERTCPTCGHPTIIKGKEEYGGGWLCWAKKGGCGAKFKGDDPAISEQQVGKVENDDIYTLVNTILKMAKKRCLVDGAIALARCSDIFTQDVEDGEQVLPPVPPQRPVSISTMKGREIPSREPQRPQARLSEPLPDDAPPIEAYMEPPPARGTAIRDDAPATKADYEEIHLRAKKKAVEPDGLEACCQLVCNKSLSALTHGDANKVILALSRIESQKSRA